MFVGSPQSSSQPGGNRSAMAARNTPATPISKAAGNAGHQTFQDQGIAFGTVGWSLSCTPTIGNTAQG
jgi:hypothetical protein